MRPLFIDPRDIRNLFLYVLFVGVIPFASIIAGIVITKEKYVDYSIYAGAALAVSGLVLVWWFFDRIPPGPNEAELKRRMAEMIARGETLATESTEPLTAAEVSWLTRLNYILVGALVVVLGGIAFMGYFPAKEMAGDPWTYVIPISLGLGFAFLIYKYSLLLPKIVKAGKKDVVNGFITSRRKEIRRHSNDYFLTVGTKELEVSKRDYRTYNVGEIVRMDYIKDFGGMVMKITRVSRP